MSLAESAPATAPVAQAPARAYRIYVLVLLTAVYTFNFIDRQIIGILSPFIKADLGLADWQLGVLKGFAFAVLYTVLGIPIARLADRYNRVTIISLALATWSGFTALSGAAMNFAQLAAARVGVGIGEAGGSPPSHSLISDYYPKEKRAGALAFFAMGIPIGITLAYLGAGWLTQNFSWRTAFIVVGVPGVLLAVLVKLTLKEPKRGATDAPGLPDMFKGMDFNTPTGAVERFFKWMTGALPKKAGEATFREIALLWRAARHLLSIPSYRAVVFGLAWASFSSYAVGGWIVDFFARSHPGFSIASVLFWLGVISGTTYVAGAYLGGVIVDRLALKSKTVYGAMPAIALAINTPVFLGFMWVDGPVAALALSALSHLLIGCYLGPSFALAQTLAPISIRALSTAIFFFILNMIALGFGPTYVGVLSSMLTGGMGEELALRVALSSLIVPGGLGLYFYWRITRTIDADWAKATAGGAPAAAH